MLRTIGIALNTVVLILSIFTIFPDIATNEEIKTFICLAIIVIQLLSILVGNIYQKTVEKESIKNIMGFDLSKKELIKRLVPYKKDSVLGAREEMRQGLIALTTVFIICCIYWAFMTGEARKFIIVVCIISIAFIYADYITHNSFYTKKYDESFLGYNDSTPNTIRGLARIYRYEYLKFRFNRFTKREDYKSLSKYIKPSGYWTDPQDNQNRDWTNHQDNQILQDKCIRFILFSKIDAMKNPELYYGAVIAFFNIFLILPNVPDIVFENILPFGIETNEMMIPYILIAVNVIFAVINIVAIASYENNCTLLSDIANALGENGNPRMRFVQYEKLQGKYDFKLIRARGIFMFNSLAIDAGIDLDEFLKIESQNIEIGKGEIVGTVSNENNGGAYLKYRMLYIHKFHTNFQRFFHTVILSYIALFFLLTDLGIELYTIGIVFSIVSALVLIFGIFILPNIGRCRIARQCQKLNDKLNNKN